MIIVLFGKPGAGKGTQAPLLARSSSTFRRSPPATCCAPRVRAGTTLGLEAKAYMDRGDLVPDSVILGIVGEELAQPQYARGVILDGVVRTVPQAEGLERDAADARAQTSTRCSRSTSTTRRSCVGLSTRTVCENCQTPYTGRERRQPCATSAAARSCVARTTIPRRCARGSASTTSRRRRCSTGTSRTATRSSCVDAVGAVGRRSRARALEALGRRDPAQVGARDRTDGAGGKILARDASSMLRGAVRPGISTGELDRSPRISFAATTARCRRSRDCTDFRAASARR